MTDTPQWPLTSKSDDEQVTSAFLNEWLPSDPLDTPELPRLVFPAPLVDKALLGRDDKEDLP